MLPISQGRKLQPFSHRFLPRGRLITCVCVFRVFLFKNHQLKRSRGHLAQWRSGRLLSGRACGWGGRWLSFEFERLPEASWACVLPRTEDPEGNFWEEGRFFTDTLREGTGRGGRGTPSIIVHAFSPTAATLGVRLSLPRVFPLISRQAKNAKGKRQWPRGTGVASLRTFAAWREIVCPRC